MLKTHHKFLLIAFPVIILGIGFYASLLIALILLIMGHLQSAGVCILCGVLGRIIGKNLARKGYPLIPILVREGWINKDQVDIRIRKRVEIETVDVETKQTVIEDSSKSTTYVSNEEKGGKREG